METVMKRQGKFIQPWLGKCALSLILAVGLVSTAFAAQFDPPYYELEKKHGTGREPRFTVLVFQLIPAENCYVYFTGVTGTGAGAGAGGAGGT
jgi:hypothetical protein